MKCDLEKETIFLLLFISIVCFQMFACSSDFAFSGYETSTDLRGPMEKEYNMMFADSRRSSFLPFRVDVEGSIEWSQRIDLKEERAFNPKAILVSSSTLIAYSDTQIIAFENNGKKLWEQNIVYGSPVSISEGKVFFREAKAKAKELSAVHMDGSEVTDKMIILNSHEDAYPIYLEPLSDGLIAMCTYRVGVEDGTPKTVFYKKTYPSLNYLWVSSFTTDMGFGPLHIRESNRFIVTTVDEIWVYNSSPPDIEEELFRYPHPLPQLLQASASENDILYILGVEEDQLVLIALSLDGEEIWRFSGFLDTGFNKQLIPPILGPDGSVHIALGNQLSTVREGKLVRRFTSQAGDISYGTSLADNSILLVAGMTLLQIDSTGELILDVVFEESLVTPPVVDAEGKIYVASAQKLYKII
jgi:hypothetical protein